MFEVDERFLGRKDEVVALLGEVIVGLDNLEVSRHRNDAVHGDEEADDSLCDNVPR